MSIDAKIRNEELQYDIHREAAKISALSSGKIDEYEYLAVEEILPSDQSQMIEQFKFIYSPLGKEVKGFTNLKACWTAENKINWQHIPKHKRNSEIKKELNQIKTTEEQIDRRNLIYETNKYTYKATRSVGDSILMVKLR